VALYMVFFASARFRLPIEGLFLAWAGVLVAAALRLAPGMRRAGAPAWAALAGILLAFILAQSGLQAAGARAHLRRPETLIARGEQIAVQTSERAIPLFGEEEIPLDRRRGRFLRLRFNAFRQGPHRDAPNNGRVKLTFLDEAGRSLPWLDSPAYILEALPAGRWVSAGFKTHIPPQARSCRVEINPDRGSPDILILDQPTLRYALGNDIFLEAGFPYLRYEE
jgi:hypothetical protein